jgi:hypothetical protein
VNSFRDPWFDTSPPFLIHWQSACPYLRPDSQTAQSAGSAAKLGSKAAITIVRGSADVSSGSKQIDVIAYATLAGTGAEHCRNHAKHGV